MLAMGNKNEPSDEWPIDARRLSSDEESREEPNFAAQSLVIANIWERAGLLSPVGERYFISVWDLMPTSYSVVR